MGSVLKIPAINAPEKIETLFFPEDDLFYLIKEYIGSEAADIYDNVLTELQNYREREADE